MSSSSSIALIVCRMRCSRSLLLLGLSGYTLSLIIPHSQKSQTWGRVNVLAMRFYRRDWSKIGRLHSGTDGKREVRRGAVLLPHDRLKRGIPLCIGNNLGQHFKVALTRHGIIKNARPSKAYRRNATPEHQTAYVQFCFFYHSRILFTSVNVVFAVYPSIRLEARFISPQNVVNECWIGLALTDEPLTKFERRPVISVRQCLLEHTDTASS